MSDSGLIDVPTGRKLDESPSRPPGWFGDVRTLPDADADHIELARRYFVETSDDEYEHDGKVWISKTTGERFRVARLRSPARERSARYGRRALRHSRGRRARIPATRGSLVERRRASISDPSGLRSSMKKKLAPWYETYPRKPGRAKTSTSLSRWMEADAAAISKTLDARPTQPAHLAPTWWLRYSAPKRVGTRARGRAVNQILFDLGIRRAISTRTGWRVRSCERARFESEDPYCALCSSVATHGWVHVASQHSSARSVCEILTRTRARSDVELRVVSSTLSKTSE